MTVVEALILGILQGLTEFLPVSSSGHLVLARQVLEVMPDEPSPAVELIAHLGTLLAVFVVFRERLFNLTGYVFAGGWSEAKRNGFREAWWGTDDGRLLTCIGVSMIPTAILGLCLKDIVYETFSSSKAAGVGLLVTSALLGLAFLKRTTPGRFVQFTVLIAALVGLAQGCALFPGVSRSGATIVVALLLGMRSEKAFEFSFLMVVPAILGISVAELFQAGQANGIGLVPGVVLLLSSFAFGWAALFALRGIVARNSIGYFALYCLPLALAALFLL